MGWSKTPLLDIGDTVQASQLHEVRSAISERREAVGLAALGSGSYVGITCAASTINDFRGYIGTLIGYFYDESAGGGWNLWTKATLFTHVFGGGRTNWMNTPARDDAGETFGDTLPAGTIMYVEHLNEMQSVLNELEHLLRTVSIMSGGYARIIIPDTDWEPTKADAVLAWENNIGSVTPFTGSVGQGDTGVALMLNEQAGPQYQILGTPVEGVYRSCYEVDMPASVSGGFTLLTLKSAVAEADSVTSWNDYTAAVYYGTTLPGDTEWDWGTLLTSKSIAPNEGAFDFDAFSVGIGACDTLYLMGRGHDEVDYGFLESEDWANSDDRYCAWGSPESLGFKCIFDYHS